MKNYKIIGENQEMVSDLINSLNLEEHISLRHPKEGNSCPLEVYCKMKYNPHNSEEFPKGRLTIYMNESKPEIKVDNAKSIHFQYGSRYLGSMIIDGLLIEFEDESVKDEGKDIADLEEALSSLSQ
jgi:hypothetical protein